MNHELIVMYIFTLFYRQERTRYYKNRQLATERPTEYLSMIVDGMDQNKTNIPSLVNFLYAALSVYSVLVPTYIKVMNATHFSNFNIFMRL